MISDQKKKKKNLSKIKLPARIQTFFFAWIKNKRAVIVAVGMSTVIFKSLIGIRKLFAKINHFSHYVRLL